MPGGFALNPVPSRRRTHRAQYPGLGFPIDQLILGIHDEATRVAYFVLGLFLALLSFAVWCVWQVRTGFPSHAPAQYLEIDRHLRTFAWTLLGFSTIGVTCAFAIVRRRRWAYHALALLVSMAAINAAVIRAVMPPRVVVDPDWPLVLALSVFAALCWHRALARQADT